MKNLIIFTAFLVLPLIAWADDFQLTSTAFGEGTMIPAQYTCDGSDINPPLSFKNIPAQSKSLVLTVSDPDAPMGRWSHWVVYNIPANVHKIAENSDPGTEGINDFGKVAYGGPCPPGGKVHHYIFQAYALDGTLTISQGATMNEVESSLQGHIIAQTRLVGTYQK